MTSTTSNLETNTIESTPTTNTTANDVQPDNPSIIALNAQNSNKLIGNNYPIWKVQMTTLLVGYDLIGFVDGTNTCPAPSHHDFSYWKCQDQLILYVIISFVEQYVISMLGNVRTSKQAWNVLNKAFASKTRARVMHLKESLSRSMKGSKSVTEFLTSIKTLGDELAIINSPVDDMDLVMHTLNGLEVEYKEVSAALRTREIPVTFHELYEMLIDY